jgi:hypothetical protein
MDDIRRQERTDMVAKALSQGLIYKNGNSFSTTGADSEAALAKLGLSVDDLDDFDNEVYESA